MAKVLNRRTFLKVSATAGGALAIGTYIPGLRDSSTLEAAGVFQPNVWVKIGADDSVTITLTQLEMGQGVMTAMPLLLAEELDVDHVRVAADRAVLAILLFGAAGAVEGNDDPFPAGGTDVAALVPGQATFLSPFPDHA